MQGSLQGEREKNELDLGGEKYLSDGQKGKTKSLKDRSTSNKLHSPVVSTKAVPLSLSLYLSTSRSPLVNVT